MLSYLGVGAVVELNSFIIKDNGEYVKDLVSKFILFDLEFVRSCGKEFFFKYLIGQEKKWHFYLTEL